MAFYRKLDPSRPEIRVLIFVEPPEGSSSELAHCELEHVLLNDFTEDFKDFLATREDGADKSEQAVREDWMKASMAQFPDHQAASQNFINLPIWRQQIQDADKNRSSQPWQQILEDSGTDIGPRSFLPDDIDQALKYSIAINRTSSWDRPALPDKYCTPNKPGSRYFTHRPRYNWGDYEAVSYCWESEELDGKMVLEGAVIPITKNLSALLKQLKKSSDAKSGMKVWIDALCIDQREITERNQQVKLMKRIYKSAFAVLVWLGETNAISDEAIDFISRLSISIMQKKEEWRGISSMSEEDFDGWFQHFWDTTNLSNMPWWSFFRFFSGNYCMQPSPLFPLFCSYS